MERVIGDDDLLEEILLHLPAEIVHACKLVSKPWCNLISSLRFRRRHATHHQNLLASSSKILMFNHEDRSEITLFDISNGVIKTSTIESGKLLSSIQLYYDKFRQKTDEYKKIEFLICDVYNGLYLFSLRTKEEEFDEFGIRYNYGELSCLVCNPLTKEYHEIPLLSELKSAPLAGLAFAPTSKPCGYYKVLISYLNEAYHTDWWNKEFIVQVYSSETRTWEKFGGMIDESFYNSKYVVWDNCLILVPRDAWHGPVNVLDSERLCITESSPMLPNFIENELRYSMIYYFGESGGFLYVIIEYSNHDSCMHKFTLWEMRGVDGSWKEKFEVNIETDFIVLHVYREGEHVRLLMWDTSILKLYYCLNGIKESLQEAGDLDYRKWSIRSHTLTLYPLGER